MASRRDGPGITFRGTPGSDEGCRDVTTGAASRGVMHGVDGLGRDGGRRDSSRRPPFAFLRAAPRPETPPQAGIAASTPRPARFRRSGDLKTGIRDSKSRDLRIEIRNPNFALQDSSIAFETQPDGPGITFARWLAPCKSGRAGLGASWGWCRGGRDGGRRDSSRRPPFVFAPPSASTRTRRNWAAQCGPATDQ